MKWITPRPAISVFVVLLTAASLVASEPQKMERFVPNYIAVDDVVPSSPNGNPSSQIKKGTLVSARNPNADVLDLQTEDGQAGLADSSYFSRLGSSIEITEDAKRVADASNAFAFELYQQVRRQEGNLFLSPTSVSTALAMTYAGSSGLTKQQMAKVLRLSGLQNPHDGFSTLLDLLNSSGDRNGYLLNTANRLWGARDYQFQDNFTALTKNQYNAELQTLDFSQPDRARQMINDWVEQRTRKRIQNLVPRGILQNDTRLVLTNAIYFQGGWSSEFPEKATKKAPFHVTTTEEISVQTMVQQENFSYTEDADAQILSMPYRGHELSMIVVLPRKTDGLGELEGKLTSQRFGRWMKSLRNDRPVETYLPKFEMDSRFLLSDALKSMGMTTAFNDQANFSAMSKSEALMISEVIHQAFVEVDEEGTEAAAATAVVIAPTSAAPFEPREPPQPIVFRADHPFLFMIRDNRTGAVLFMGRMERPQRV